MNVQDSNKILSILKARSAIDVEDLRRQANLPICSERFYKLLDQMKEKDLISNGEGKTSL